MKMGMKWEENGYIKGAGGGECGANGVDIP